MQQLNIEGKRSGEGFADRKFDIIVRTWLLSHLASPSTFVNQRQKPMKGQDKFSLIFFSEPKLLVRFWIAPEALLVGCRYV